MTLTRSLKWGVGLMVVAFTLRASLHLVSRNYNLAAEANGLYAILDWTEGKPLYSPTTQRPYAINLYPPVSAWVGGGLLRMLGTSALAHRVLALRFLTLLLFGGLLILLWRTLSLVPDINRASLGIAVVLALPKLIDYVTTTRNDVLSLFLEFTVAAAFVTYLKKGKVHWLIGTGLFALASIFTRPTGIAFFCAAVLWLAIQRQWLRCLALAVGVTVCTVALFASLNHLYAGAFFENVVLANIRGWRPINREFFDNSLLSFLASYALFALLSLSGIKKSGATKTPAFFFALALGTSLLLSSSLFLRAGGDVNYFFLPLLLLIPACARGIERGILYFRSRILWEGAFFAQSLIVAFILLVKTHSAFSPAFLPYETAAQRLREQDPYGYLMGLYAQNLGIYLRGWAYHGPDVTNAGNIAGNAHPSFRWVQKDLATAIDQKTIRTIVIADPKCAAECPLTLGAPYEAFTFRECPYLWLCAYRRDSSPTNLWSRNESN